MVLPADAEGGGNEAMMSRSVRGRFRIAVLVAAALLVVACSDGGDGGSGGGPLTVALHYDGEQADSPSLPGNTTHEAAARFTPAETASLAGGELIAVRFFIETVPDGCRVKIYGEGTPGSPGPLLYEADVTSAVTGGAWNEHVLGSPLPLPAGDLWLGIEFMDVQSQRTIGCDPGPAAANGRWLYDSGSQVWAPFAVSINWNIRGVVELEP
jgi:hypothetical protein